MMTNMADGCNDCRAQGDQAEAKRGLHAHTIVTLCVSVLLAGVNLAYCPGFLWAIFPLAGMCIGLACHYIGLKHHNAA